MTDQPLAMSPQQLREWHASEAAWREEGLTCDGLFDDVRLAELSEAAAFHRSACRVVERLEQENARLREVLEDIADWGCDMQPGPPCSVDALTDVDVCPPCRARRALSESEKPNAE